MNHVQDLDDILASKLDDEGRNPSVTETDNPSQVPLADQSLGVSCQEAINNLVLE